MNRKLVTLAALVILGLALADTAGTHLNSAYLAGFALAGYAAYRFAVLATRKATR